MLDPNTTMSATSTATRITEELSILARESFASLSTTALMFVLPFLYSSAMALIFEQA